jgi:hypothetical protein
MTPEWPDVDEGLLDPKEAATKVFEAQVDVIAATVKAGQEQEGETHKAAEARDSARLAALAAEDKAVADDFRSTAAADRAVDLANLQVFYTGLSTLAVGAVERSRAGAEVVQKASAAIVTLYTGLLGFVFVASDNPLPARGILAPVFLGLSVVLSTAYLAYLNPVKDTTNGPAALAGVEPRVFARLNATIEAASKIATRRSYALRASVVALGVGLVYISLPFLTLGTTPATAQPTPASTAAAWPTPASGVPDSLNTILFKAQVDEVAKARQAAADNAVEKPAVDDTVALLLLAGLGLAVTLLVPAVWRAK